MPNYRKKANIINWLLAMWAFSCASMAALIAVALQTPYLPFVSKLLATKFGLALLLVATPALVVSAASLVLFGVFALIRRALPEHYVKTRKLLTAACLGSVLTPLVWMTLVATLPWTWPVLLGLALATSLACLVLRATGMAAHYLAFGSPAAEQQALSHLNEEHYGNVYGFLNRVDGIKANTPLLDCLLDGESVFDRMASQYHASEDKLAALQQGRGFFIWPFASRSQAIQRELMHSQSILSAMRMMVGKELNRSASAPSNLNVRTFNEHIDDLVGLDYKTRLAILELLAKDYQRTSKRIIRYKEAKGLIWWFVWGRQSTIRRMERHAQSLIMAMINLVPGPGPLAEDRHDEAAEVVAYDDEVDEVEELMDQDPELFPELSLKSVRAFLKRTPVESAALMARKNQSSVKSTPFDDQVDTNFSDPLPFTPFVNPKPPSVHGVGEDRAGAVHLMSREEVRRQSHQVSHQAAVDTSLFAIRKRREKRVPVQPNDASDLTHFYEHFDDYRKDKNHWNYTNEQRNKMKWLKKLLVSKRGGANRRLQLKVSTQAMTILDINPHALPETFYWMSFDHDNLPLGFFLDESVRNEVHLCYDPDYRLQQLDSMDEFELAQRLDLAAMDGPSITVIRGASMETKISRFREEVCPHLSSHVADLYGRASKFTQQYMAYFAYDARWGDSLNMSCAEQAAKAVSTLADTLQRECGLELPGTTRFVLTACGMKLSAFKGWIDLILLAKDPVQQRRYLSEPGDYGRSDYRREQMLPECASLALTKHALRTGYRVIHPFMGRFSEDQKVWKPTEDYLGPPFYPGVDALSVFKKRSFVGKSDTFFSELFYRMAGLYVDDFEDALRFESACLQKHELDPRCWIRPGDADYPAYISKVEAYVDELQAYITKNNVNVRLLNKDHRSAMVTKTVESDDLHQYDLSSAVGSDSGDGQGGVAELTFLLENQLQLDPATCQAIKSELEQMNDCAKKYGGETFERLRDVVKSKDSSDAQRLAALRELVFRVTAGKIWLRREQAIAVLLGRADQQLLQIDTGEGKTSIIALIALMKQFAPEPVDQVRILTHTEPEADAALVLLNQLVPALELRVGRMQIGDAMYNQSLDIVSAPVTKAVINDLLDERDDPGSRGSNQRIQLIVDEFDNAVIDVAASTTMQIVADAGRQLTCADDACIAFLRVIYTGVDAKEDARAIMQKLDVLDGMDRSYWDAISSGAQKEEEIAYWMRAAKAAQRQQLNQDYTIVSGQGEKGVELSVKIVSKETGRRDDHSIWGDGLHQMVAIKERVRQQDNRIVVPPIQTVERADDVLSFLSRYPHIIGLTGTLGDSLSVAHQEAIVFGNDHPPEQKAIIFPRAKRYDHEYREPIDVVTSHGPDCDDIHDPFEFPRKAIDPDSEKPIIYTVYNKRLDYPAQVKESTEEHDEAIVDAIRRCQQRGLSCMVFLDSIADCERLYHGLQLNESFVNIDRVQVFDDGGESHAWRQTEEVVKRQAIQPGMVTITTAAGGRAIDVDVNVGIPTREHLARVLVQEKGRIGRKQAGSVYPILCRQDFVADSGMGQATLVATKGFFADRESGLIDAAHKNRPKPN